MESGQSCTRHTPPEFRLQPDSSSPASAGSPVSRAEARGELPPEGGTQTPPVNYQAYPARVPASAGSPVSRAEARGELPPEGGTHTPPVNYCFGGVDSAADVSYYLGDARSYLENGEFNNEGNRLLGIALPVLVPA